MLTVVVVEIRRGQRKAVVVPMTPRAQIEAQVVTTLLGGLWEDVE
jgi:hypothetical protein